jgi:AGZA family xanthine/uracil permease-like MFS transporter
VNVGGRTGLTAVVVGLLFIAAIFLAPLAASIPSYATAPALFFVACLMTEGLKDIDWQDITEYVPAMIIAIAMPLTFSIAHAIGLGFIAYVGIKLLSGRWREAHPAVVVIALAFALKIVVQ